MNSIFVKQEDIAPVDTNTSFEGISRHEEDISKGMARIHGKKGLVAPVSNEQGKVIDKFKSTIVLGKVYRDASFASNEDFIPLSMQEKVTPINEEPVINIPEIKEEIKVPKEVSIILEGAFGKFKSKYVDIIDNKDYVVLVYSLDSDSVFIPPISNDTITITSDFLIECSFKGITFEVPSINLGFIYFQVTGTSTTANDELLENLKIE